MLGKGPVIQVTITYINEQMILVEYFVSFLLIKLIYNIYYYNIRTSTKCITMT